MLRGLLLLMTCRNLRSVLWLWRRLLRYGRTLRQRIRVLRRILEDARPRLGCLLIGLALVVLHLILLGFQMKVLIMLLGLEPWAVRNSRLMSDLALRNLCASGLVWHHGL
jgi:hypothetical protein